MSGDKEKDKGDYLGYGVYADTLWNRVEAALNKDQGDPDKLGDDPLVVGIFGEWGAGKSKLLSLILERAQRQRNERIAAHKRDDGFSLTVPVFFQPWKYEHEKHLLVPLLLHIEAELTRCLTLAETTSDKAKGKAVSVAQAVKAHVPAVVEGFKTLWGAARTAYQLAEPASAGVLMPLAEWLAGQLAKDGSDKKEVTTPMTKFRWEAEGGRSYYELHEVLKAVTRPTPEGIKKHLPNAKVDSSFHINFVIFIDDLDRCLPEKAVETLELIKTVFNLESFAFVLALDEEVVERGIGHRYKDYALQNKKSEMPITGFEYLEKIVHLPFRLPGLTRHQASLFLEKYEKEHAAAATPERWWFAPRPADQDGKKGEMGQRSELGQEVLADLASLVLNAFTAYVPRKLVRLVELLHRVQEVAHTRGRVLTVGGSQGTDVRVVIALLMLQLFQPDLFRLVRRKQQSFPLLLAAFATRPNGYREIADPAIADVDLWLWVVDESAGDDNAWIQSSDVSKVMDAVVLKLAKKYHVVTDRGGPVRFEQRAEDGEVVTVTEYDTNRTREQRSRAQNVKLPLIAQIVEHRSTHRHAFDPLRLFHALAGALEQGWDSNKSGAVSPAANIRISDYFELMVASSSATQREADFVSASVTISRSIQAQISTQSVRYPDRLFADITSDQPEVQANLVANNELEGGKYLELDAAQHLLEQLSRWQGSLEDQERSEGKLRLTRGLNIIAPLVPRELGREFLSLVDDPESIPFHIPGRPPAFNSVEEAQRAADRADLWSALGVDDRFDAKCFHLPKSRLPENVNDSEREPIPGFVRVFEADQERFQPFEGPSVTLKPYYLARYLTTVDQYARFIEAGGYGDPAEKKPDWWDTLGWLWRTGRWDSQVKEKTYREYLASRKPELRGAPMDWAEQQTHGSRPVMRLNWFEARAYANWLTLQLAGELQGLPSGYAVRLPTEAQWERAARARDATSADDRQYPWDGADEKTAHLHANIRASDIGRPSPVGLFAPNPLGLCDLSGNVWEWQNSLYLPGGKEQDKGLKTDVTTLKTHEEFDQSDRPALRGGAWFNPAVNARASIRDRDLPVSWFDDVGFRVVLSLPE